MRSLVIRAMLPVMAGLLAVPIQAGADPSTPAAAHLTASTAVEEPAGADGYAAVPVAQRWEVLGSGWRGSNDRAWTTSGDGAGFHILVADAGRGYAWRTVATLSESGFDVDSWIGNACVTGDGSKAVVAYAPRTFTNEAHLFERGAFTAVVDLDSGAVTKLPLTSSLAYFSPSCGAGSTAIITQDGGVDLARTRLYRVDTRTGEVARPITVRGQLTSAVPTAHGIVAADDGAVVKVRADGSRRVIATADGVPFHLTPDAAGGLVFMDRRGDLAAVRRVGAGAVRRAPQSVRATGLLATGPLMESGVTRSASGRVFLTGELEPSGSLPRFVSSAGSSKDATSSVQGEVLLEPVATSGLANPSAGGDPTVLTRPFSVDALVTDTAETFTFTMTPPSAFSAGQLRTHPSLRSDPSRTGPARVAAAGSPTNPVEAERTCSVPRNSARDQVMQPKPRQVEWAVDQAVRNTLDLSRGANWKNLGMPAYTPQGLFPSLTLNGGGAVPAQVMLGVIAQESNLWQAPGHVIPGVTGNPLIGNYYGREIYNASPDDDWDVRWADADCGYGVSQVTDGMRLSDTGMTYQTKRAVALDFAANVAAGVRILQQKWNQTRGAGMVLNNGDASKLENWFFAVWAYNSGFHPQSQAGQHNGAWGVGWLNNPVNPIYPANRAPFLEYTSTDANHPQDWPYPEKVLGWAGHPVEILEAPEVPVAGYRAAWWNGDSISGPRNRANVKPPVDLFCKTSNNCTPGRSYAPGAPEVIGQPAGPCAHRNSVGQYDLKCWYNGDATWKADCDFSCGNELLRFSPDYAYQPDGTAYQPNCALNGLPAGALVIDDQPDTVPSVRPGCTRTFTNQGTFSLSFANDASGDYPSKVDFHQIGAGFGGHFWFAHTRAWGLRDNSMQVTGTWTLNKQLNQWSRVLVHMPDHGAHTQQARYEVLLGNGIRTRVTLQRTQSNRWVSLGSFPFAGTPRVRLRSVTGDGDDGVKPVEGENIAFDAVAFQPLAAKPLHIVVSLGDSYASGEGASVEGGGDYYPESDNNGDDPSAQNSCHRSKYAWSRRGALSGSTTRIGDRSDAWAPLVEHHLIACSGAQTEHLLPVTSVTPPLTPPANAFGQTGAGRFGEVSQLDRGFVDQDTTLVTLSIGGNDARFSDVIEECLVYAGLKACQDATLPGSSVPAGQEVPDLIQGKVEDSIVTVLREIRRKAPNAKIMLMGYPRLLENRGNCIEVIDEPEADWLNSMSDLMAKHMNEAVTRANAEAGKVFTWFSDPRDEYTGRAVCGSPEEVHGLVSYFNKTPGEPPEKAFSQQSFHPKSPGQDTYALSMNETLRRMGL